MLLSENVMPTKLLKFSMAAALVALCVSHQPASSAA
jgi:hypothetical protein